jgi:hypothetical protein
MRLLNEGVYKQIRKVSNLNRGIEEALKLIVEDSELQTAIREYAIKNEVSHKGYGEYGSGIREYYGVNDTFRDKRIIFWRGNKITDCKFKDELYIGPDPKGEVMPFYLRYWINDGSSWCPDFSYYNLQINQMENGTFYLEKLKPDSTEMKRKVEIAGRRVIDIPFLQDLPTSVFISGLEKAVRHLIKPRN